MPSSQSAETPQISAPTKKMVRVVIFTETGHKRRKPQPVTDVVPPPGGIHAHALAQRVLIVSMNAIQPGQMHPPGHQYEGATNASEIVAVLTQPHKTLSLKIEIQVVSRINKNVMFQGPPLFLGITRV